MLNTTNNKKETKTLLVYNNILRRNSSATEETYVRQFPVWCFSTYACKILYLCVCVCEWSTISIIIKTVNIIIWYVQFFLVCDSLSCYYFNFRCFDTHFYLLAGLCLHLKMTYLELLKTSQGNVNKRLYLCRNLNLM